ncbi:Zn-ribbon domain-containing OB-fold protein [Halorubrum laminariae]|uniref:Zn-ribbon domain-containing OB-fold protein n=1 Tax=Halorubrum laminariae TaxID=1433523 RepID=A0ABD6BXA6_9EURY|nr:OB-fold domain-containing protein [Halorubrum laminariae]
MSDDAADAADAGPVPATNAGYDEWVDAIADGEGYALVCSNGHGSLPPRRVCPECGSTDLSREPLDATGTVETYSVVHVPAPRFADDAPYVTAIVDFGPVRVTGVVRGIDPEPNAIEAGDELEASVGTRETDGERIVVFRPTDGA